MFFYNSKSPLTSYLALYASFEYIRGVRSLEIFYSSSAGSTVMQAVIVPEVIVPAVILPAVIVPAVILPAVIVPALILPAVIVPAMFFFCWR